MNSPKFEPLREHASYCDDWAIIAAHNTVVLNQKLDFIIAVLCGEADDSP